MAVTLLATFSISILLLTVTIPAATGEKTSFINSMDPKSLGMKNEKLSHLRFYWHDILSGPNPTSVTVIKSPKNLNSSTVFGQMNTFDDPLTEGPDLSSKLIGRAQGFYSSASQQEVALLAVMNFVFTVGKYNGSTIAVHGRNAIFNETREMTVIGGSGVFRFARGYVQIKTLKLDLKTGDATVEYNAYVLHS